MIIPTAEPFFFSGNKTGCLLIHGFTGTPKEMRWMGEYLAEQGFSVLGVRLAGHATDPEDMIRSRYADWMHSVEDGYHLLRGIADRVYLVGLSMGGVLSLLMATRLDVAGVVAMSVPYEIPDLRLKYAKLLSKIIKYVPKDDENGEGWVDKDAWRIHVAYPQNPVRSAGELAEMMAEMRAALPDVNVPTLLVHSRNDKGLPQDSMDRIYAALGTSDKEMMWVTESGHVIPREPAKAEVFPKVADFIRRVAKEG